jgi:hypothetical protein
MALGMSAVLVKPGMSAKIRIPVLNDREFTGAVAGSSWSLNSEQRTLRTEVDFDNSDEALRPGMYAHATIPVDHPDSLCLPAQAVVVRDGVTFCMCVKDGKATKTPIRVGAREAGRVEALKKLVPSDEPNQRPSWQDFTGDELVVVSKPGDLTDGQQVELADDAPAGK